MDRDDCPPIERVLAETGSRRAALAALLGGGLVGASSVAALAKPGKGKGKGATRGKGKGKGHKKGAGKGQWRLGDG